VRGLRAQVDELATEAAGLEERQRQATAEAMTAEEQRRAEIAARLDELRSTVTAEKTRFDSLVPSFEQQFTAAQAAREQQHRDVISSFDEETRALVQRVSDEAEKTTAEVRDGVDTLLTESATRVDAVLEDVRTKRDEVDDLYSVITNTGTASAFRDDAEQQKKAANTWRLVAVVFGVLAAVATGWAALSGSDESTQSLIARLALGAAAGGIAAYAARQSGRHRDREEEARRLELDLPAFGPFIESLPDEVRQRVREEFLKRVFVGRKSPSDGPALTEESIGLMQDAVNVFLRAGRGRQPPA
jgi:hypothetical protein